MTVKSAQTSYIRPVRPGAGFQLPITAQNATFQDIQSDMTVNGAQSGVLDYTIAILAESAVLENGTADDDDVFGGWAKLWTNSDGY